MLGRGAYTDMVLTTHPVGLGDGLPLWHGLPEPQHLRLINATTYADGSITQAYAPAA